ncbi:helix-turn-helix transcriptional regulator [Aromatoleum toluclasticum]|uniref:helix-turn-helix transcriptional regulator n=1 Tax=Aromatoleum toluclasticum TaxID=92003 RepID=UPI001D186AC1|nr:helix-turn-helix transcriptional regulator [Aromatoleum toluclasticum]MCC4118209.1 helix-turn-helix transcriptional regulator [Aromatoleum toluclasticum]
MQLITLPESPTFDSRTDESRAQEALVGVIGSIGDVTFGREALAQLNRWMPLCWWSVYRLFDDQPPTMHASGSFGMSDGTQESWRSYRASLYRKDETFFSAKERLREADAVLLHWHAAEFSARHREAIYSRHGLRERLSIVSAHDESGLTSINFYRNDEQRAFSDNEIDALRKLARPLLVSVNRHLYLSGKSGAEGSPLAMLTKREREVCDRILKGWTHEGIAADLQVSAATVKTYRDRAFERLGIHHRNELFALVSGHLQRVP